MSETLIELGRQAAVCTACRLATTRTQVVFGVGSPAAELMFVGEAPGFHEDQQGEPFVGAAGQLLTRLLGEIGLSRDDVYIANVVKCRPPGNRDPLEDEIEACKGWLSEQFRLIDPRVVITLGNFASKLLLKTDVGITKLRGRVYPWWRGKQLVPTFHPAAALRSGEKMVTEMRKDFALAKGILVAVRVVSPPQDEDEFQPPDPRQLDLFAT